MSQQLIDHGPDSGVCPVSSGDRAPRPLGPDSLTWRYFGDWRIMLLVPWGGAMQNMLPALAAGVDEHSVADQERWQRLFRSNYPIIGVVYDGPRAAQTAAEIRGYHQTITGTDSAGQRYHALDPDTFYWAHATFFMTAMNIADYFDEPLSDDQKRQMFDEHVQWYRLYGMSMRPVPKSWEDFQQYWEHMCTEVLQDTTAVRMVLDVASLDKPPFLPGLPDPAWRLLRSQIIPHYEWLTVGMFHPAVRERLGYTWTDADERKLRRLGQAVRRTWNLIPKSQRYHPRARAGWQRASGALPADKPLVETPARYLPPADRRGDPKHYCPGL